VLKKKAHTFVHECYEWDPQNRRPVNAEIARKLLDRGNFLKHGVDVEVSGKLIRDYELILFHRVIQTILRTLHYPVSLLISSIQVPMPLQTFSQRFSRMKYPALQLCSLPPLYIYIQTYLRHADSTCID